MFCYGSEGRGRLLLGGWEPRRRRAIGGHRSAGGRRRETHRKARQKGRFEGELGQSGERRRGRTVNEGS